MNNSNKEISNRIFELYKFLIKEFKMNKKEAYKIVDSYRIVYNL